MRRNFIYFYPLIIFIFLVNYHFYSFYQNNFLSMLRIIKNQKEKLFVEKIQSQHPYYEIWRLLKGNKNVIFVNEEKNIKSIDYTTTYFMNRNTTKKTTHYLSELKLMINYFAYPRNILSVSFLQLINYQNLLKEGDYIISDVDLGEFAKLNFLNLYNYSGQITTKQNINNLLSKIELVPIVKKQYQIINRHPENPYYIYQVIK